MNSIHNNGPDDKLLNDDIEKLDQAYQQLSSEEPPELLDHAILSSAHRAVEKNDHWLDFGWIHGLTTAVVVVLAVSIILTQRQPVDLDENGLSPADVRSLGQTRKAESEMSGKMREQRVDDLRANKSMLAEDALLEEKIMRANAPVEVMAASPAVAEFADEPVASGAGEIEIDAVKKDADKITVARSSLSAEDVQLQAILMLKQAGDDSWKTELKIFIENHPDYPIPEELKN